MRDLIRKISALLVSLAMLTPAAAVYADNVTGADDTEETVETVETVDDSEEADDAEDSEDSDESEEAEATLAPVTTSSSTSTFSDISAEQYAWAEPFIIEMAKKGYITGYEDGTFQPDNEVTRLEGLALFSRAMGSNNEVNEPILEIAHEQYDEMLTNYTLSWGSDEIVYLLYKGALQKSDLDTDLLGTEKNMPMKRYEAAIIITKAMGGEKEATADSGVTLSYTDAKSIPSNAIQYVQYSTDKGIMKGMDDGSFSPETSVSRSQMAVMLSRTVDQTNYTFSSVKLTDIDTSTRTVTVKDSDGNSEKLVYSDDTVMRDMGETTQAKEMTVGVQAIITMSGDTLVGIDTIASEPDTTVTGQYKSMSTSNGTISIRMIPTGETQAVKYECASDVAITFDGSPATMSSFSDGVYLTMEIVDGKVSVLKGETKTVKITSAKVESLDIDDEVTITISHGDSDYDGKTYTVADDVSVTKNSKTSDLRSIYTGDTVTLTVVYGVVEKIEATSKSGTVEGTVQAVTISSSPTITVRVDGTDTVYDVTSDVTIQINGEDGKLSDFSVGDTVKITTESNAVTKIVAESVQESSGSATGVVTGVNTSYKVITVRTDSGDTMQFQCPDSGKTVTVFITATGTTKKLSNIAADQSIEVKYTVSNGVYIATLVIILSE
ncbi:MAG: S-layer homology domain-containing protein [Oscillospiraceae bacterium]|nr:S-layer homology domain-containing protein [Oscillospiraceae bacterium]